MLSEHLKASQHHLLVDNQKLCARFYSHRELVNDENIFPLCFVLAQQPGNLSSCQTVDKARCVFTISSTLRCESFWKSLLVFNYFAHKSNSLSFMSRCTLSRIIKSIQSISLESRCVIFTSIHGLTSESWLPMPLQSRYVKVCMSHSLFFQLIKGTLLSW